jgi:hypothetical protein
MTEDEKFIEELEDRALRLQQIMVSKDEIFWLCDLARKALKAKEVR